MRVSAFGSIAVLLLLGCPTGMALAEPILPPNSVEQAAASQGASMARADGEHAAASDAAPNESRKKRARALDVKGRVFVRNTLRERADAWISELDLASARLGAIYRDRKRDLRAEVEVELADGQGRVRDAYLRVGVMPGVRVQAGRFKRPISAISLASRWELPVVERGSLNDFELGNENSRRPDELTLGGRTVGVQVQYRDKDVPLEPRLTVGVFRSVVHGQVSDRPIDPTSHFPEDVFSRLELEPLPGMTAAASLAWVAHLHRAGTSDSFRHSFLGGLDLTVERGPLRVWVEGFMGQSPFHLSNDLQLRGRFLAARTIVAARLPWRSMYVEPYVTGQHLDISNELDQDTILQGGGGVNLGLGDVWRLQLAVDHVSGANRLFVDTTQIFAQLGAVF